MSEKEKETKPHNPPQNPPQIPGDRIEKSEEIYIPKK